MPQGLLQTLSASLHLIQRGDQLRAGADDRGHLARVGECLPCGQPVSGHWDDHNRFVGCRHGEIVPLSPTDGLRVVAREFRGEAPSERLGR